MILPDASKLCLVLTAGRRQFVCLRDGTKLPKQITTTIRQDAKQSYQGLVSVEVEVFAFDMEVYHIDAGGLVFCGLPLAGVQSAILLPRDLDESYARIRIKMTAVLGDTQLQPFDFQAVHAT